MGTDIVVSVSGSGAAERARASVRFLHRHRLDHQHGVQAVDFLPVRGDLPRARYRDGFRLRSLLPRPLAEYEVKPGNAKRQNQQVRHGSRL